MALQQTVDLKSGITVVDGYWKITKLNCEDKITRKSTVKTMVELSFFKDKITLESGKTHIIKRFISFDYDVILTDNVYKQSYDFAKTQLEFDGCIDC